MSPNKTKQLLFSKVIYSTGLFYGVLWKLPNGN